MTTKDPFNLEKNFDGLDHSQIRPGKLIGVAAESSKLDLDINLEDPDGVLTDDLAEAFQNAIKSILKVNPQVKPASEDIYLDLAVSSQAAQKGGYLPLEYQRYISCSQCGEKSILEMQKCPKCEGVGKVMAHRRVEIRVPKNTESGSVLRVVNEGHAPGGDLFVKIIVREEA